jgi:hypothetical protein
MREVRKGINQRDIKKMLLIQLLPIYWKIEFLLGLIAVENLCCELASNNFSLFC